MILFLHVLTWFYAAVPPGHPQQRDYCKFTENIKRNLQTSQNFISADFVYSNNIAIAQFLPSYTAVVSFAGLFGLCTLLCVFCEMMSKSKWGLPKMCTVDKYSSCGVEMRCSDCIQLSSHRLSGFWKRFDELQWSLARAVISYLAIREAESCNTFNYPDALLQFTSTQLNNAMQQKSTCSFYNGFFKNEMIHFM